MTLLEMPHEILRHIGSFLDQNSRIDFNRCLPHIDDRFVYARRVNQDLLLIHQYFIWYRRIFKCIADMEDTSRREQAIASIRLFRLFAYTSDTFFEKYVLKFTILFVKKIKQLNEDVHRQNFSRRFQRNQKKVHDDILKRQEPCVANQDPLQACEIKKILHKYKLCPLTVQTPLMP